MVDSARRAEPSAELIGLDPTSGQRQERRAAARRPLTLDGAVVALVGNGLGQTEAFMGALYSELKAHAALAGAVPVCKASVSAPPRSGRLGAHHVGGDGCNRRLRRLRLVQCAQFARRR